MTRNSTSIRSRPIRTAAEARAFIEDRIDYERRPAPVPDAFRLDGMRNLLAELGNPHERIPVVHVTGTKGKGSTSAMIAAGLQGSGLRTGLYTSPHMELVEERFRVDGELPTEAEFVAVVDRLAEIEARLKQRPTFFELVTALAWIHFEAAAVDLAVLEVGMGGRLDSTNLCRPIATVITNVSRDHERLLGDTTTKIAREKAGIVKPGIPCTTGVNDEAALEVVRATCRDAAAPLWELGKHVTAEPIPTEGRDGVEFASPSIRVTMPEGTWPDVVVPLVGPHQSDNAAIAVATLERVRRAGWAVDPDRAAAGLSELEWPLRFEIVGGDPLVVCDAAHNEASITALLNTLDTGQGGRRRVLVFAAAEDKKFREMLRLAAPAFDDVVLTRFLGNPRAVPPERLLEALTDGQPIGGRAPSVSTAADPSAGLEEARRRAGRAGLVVATGSFFLAAEIRRHARRRTSAERDSPRTRSGP